MLIYITNPFSWKDLKLMLSSSMYYRCVAECKKTLEKINNDEQDGEILFLCNLELNVSSALKVITNL